MPNNNHNYNHNNKKPNGKPQEVRKLQIMLEMEKLITAGHSHLEIMTWMNLPRTTYFRYLKELFEEDKQILRNQRVEDVITCFAVLTRRLNQLYLDTCKIVDSDSSSNPERMAAIKLAADLAALIIKVQNEGGALLYMRTLRGRAKQKQEAGEESSTELSAGGNFANRELNPEQLKAVFLPAQKLDEAELAQQQQEVQDYDRGEE